MDRRDLVRTAFASWFDPTVKPPLKYPCEFHAFDASVVFEADWRETFVPQWTTAFPDVAWDIRQVVADDEWGTAHVDLVGTHLGPFRDIEPTGRTIAWEHMFFLRFEGDLVAEMWEVYDPAQITKQLTGTS